MYVPTGSKSAYQSAYQWKDFANLAEKTPKQSIDKQNINVFTGTETLIISDAGIGEKVQLYTILGERIKEQSINSNQTEIYIHSGIYILRIGDYSKKVIIK